MTYDAAGQLATTTDARGVTLAMTYDALGRRTTVRNESITGPKRAEWVYDTLPGGKGLLSRSIRYEPAGSTNEYINEVTGYDTAGRPTGTKVTIPASEAGLCAAAGATPCAYTYGTTYRADGQVANLTLPGAAGLSSETLIHTYNDLGASSGLIGQGTVIYVGQVIYDTLGRLTQRVFGQDGHHTWLTYRVDDPTGRLVKADAIPGAQAGSLQLQLQLRRRRQPHQDFRYAGRGQPTEVARGGADSSGAGGFDGGVGSTDEGQHRSRRLSTVWNGDRFTGR